jgi:hypothetical protein
MDARRFDELAKSVAAGTSRRRFLGGLGATSLGIVGLAQGAAAEVETEGRPGRCRRCRERCRDRCQGRRPRCLDRCVERRCADVCGGPDSP